MVVENGHIDNNSYLPGNLRYLRKLHGISQEELAVKVGLNRGNIASYENGSAEPRITSLTRIARELCVSLSELVSSDLSLRPTFSKLDIHGITNRAQGSRLLQDHILHCEDQIQDLRAIMNGLGKCSNYALEANPECKTTNMLYHNFNQLYTASERMLLAQEKLLTQLKNS